MKVVESRTAIYFVDIDETLFQTSAKVRVMRNGKIIHELDNQEYNAYELQNNESYDFHEFKDGDLFKRTARPIHNVIQKIKEIHEKIKNESGSEIVLLTARQDFYDKENFLQTFRDYGMDIDNMYIERAGNLGIGSYAAKKIIMHDYLRTEKYTHVKMVDDYEKNLDVFLELQEEFPKVEFAAWKVTPNGETVRYHAT